MPERGIQRPHSRQTEDDFNAVRVAALVDRGCAVLLHLDSRLLDVGLVLPVRTLSLHAMRTHGKQRLTMLGPKSNALGRAACLVQQGCALDTWLDDGRPDYTEVLTSVVDLPNTLGIHIDIILLVLDNGVVGPAGLPELV